MPELRPIFEALSVVRRFNARFLQQLLDKGLIEWTQGDAYSLEDRLRKTFLINKKEGFLQDDMSRRLLAIHLRQTNPEQYSKVCTEAISFYESYLQDVESLKPDLLAVEWLFQKLQWLYYSQKGSKEDFFECFPEMLDILKSRRYAAEIIENVVDCLDDVNEEWEFRFLCNYCLREGIYDKEHPFKEVIEHLTNLAQRMEGETNHA